MSSPVENALARRIAPGLAVADCAPRIARLCRDTAERLRRGGTLTAFGTGGSATDAAHLNRPTTSFSPPPLIPAWPRRST
jgi:phosphoheptose isomerase